MASVLVLLSDARRQDVQDIGVLLGLFVAGSTAAGLLVGFLVKRPAQVWLAGAVSRALIPISEKVSELSASIDRAMTTVRLDRMEHDAHHKVVEAHYDAELERLVDAVKELEGRLHDVEKGIR